MILDDAKLDAPKPNVRLLVFAALTIVVLTAGVTRSLRLSAAEEAEAAGLSLPAVPAGESDLRDGD